MKKNTFPMINLPKPYRIITYIGIALFIVGIFGLEFFPNPLYQGNSNANYSGIFILFIIVGLPSALIATAIGYGKAVRALSKKPHTTSSDVQKTEDLNAEPSKKENCNDDACSAHNASYNEVCNYCGSKLDKNQSICSQCGHAQEIKCKKCGYINSSSNTYCTNCDNKLD